MTSELTENPSKEADARLSDELFISMQAGERAPVKALEDSEIRSGQIQQKEELFKQQIQEGSEIPAVNKLDSTISPERAEQLEKTVLQTDDSIVATDPFRPSFSDPFPSRQPVESDTATSHDGNWDFEDARETPVTSGQRRSPGYQNDDTGDFSNHGFRGGPEAVSNKPSIDSGVVFRSDDGGAAAPYASGVNEVPTDIQLAGGSVDENAAGARLSRPCRRRTRMPARVSVTS